MHRVFWKYLFWGAKIQVKIIVSHYTILRKNGTNNNTKKRADAGTFHLFKNVLTFRWQWCEWNVFSIYLVTKAISPSIVHDCIEWCTVLMALPVLLRLCPRPCRCWCYYLYRHYYFLSRVRRSFNLWCYRWITLLLYAVSGKVSTLSLRCYPVVSL